MGLRPAGELSAYYTVKLEFGRMGESQMRDSAPRT